MANSSSFLLVRQHVIYGICLRPYSYNPPWRWSFVYANTLSTYSIFWLKSWNSNESKLKSYSVPTFGRLKVQIHHSQIIHQKKTLTCNMSRVFLSPETSYPFSMLNKSEIQVLVNQACSKLGCDETSITPGSCMIVSVIAPWDKDFIMYNFSNFWTFCCYV